MSDYKPCPSCPDGYLWTANGPTSAPCKTCGGCALVHLDGSQLTLKERYGEPTDPEQPPD